MFSIPELYQYMSMVRRRFFNKLSDLPWEEVVKNREASFLSMRNIMMHIIDNEDWIVNYGVYGKRRETKPRPAEEYTSMKMVVDRLDEVEARTRNYLKTADEKEFARRVDLTFPTRSFNMTVEECIFQSFTEQLYHIGELIALMWQDNVEPPQMQWFYNNPRQKTA